MAQDTVSLEIMKRSVVWGWAAWLFFSLLLAAGVYLNDWAAQGIDTEIELTPGTTASVAISRPIASNLQAQLLFDHTLGQDRAELGRFEHRAAERGAQYAYFANVGEPVRLEVQLGDASKRYILEAGPASQGGDKIGRLLMMPVAGLPAGSVLPLHQEAREFPVIPAGKSQLTVIVKDVGRQIRGEHVIFSVEPPLSFKTAMPEYLWLWPFYFWPFASVILLVWLAWQATVTWKTVRAPSVG
ncbi:hypothetical protein [Ralstonia sp. UNC404CL21Col]|uniref:hypothetical protein n=1 Tax=Ralstonia sp. UNC404CL21Col TaxID=1380362 RepID=UPI0012DE0064|nr:hypothetical protein [Ralstonia sp. UNC404CL21Col]